MNINKSTVLRIAEFVSVGMASFATVFVAGLLLNQKKPQENGQGGFETAAIPAEALPEIPEDDGAFPEISYQSYRVKEGDVICVIAKNFGITEDTVISVNNIHNSRRIQIGQCLKIPSIPGILYTVRTDGETVDSIARKFKVECAKVCSVNSLSDSETLTAGTMIFVPDAKLDWVTRQEINGDLFRKPIRAHWYLSSSYGWRQSPFTGARTYHGGIDMACPHGTRVYAALPGTVSSTGYNNTYGNYVIVNHHSGYRSLYAHLSEIKTRKGEYVGQNSVIGYVGSTGLSTGPHLHFAVFKNGRQVNPANLWN